jgi:hypothetical protein
LLSLQKYIEDETKAAQEKHNLLAANQKETLRSVDELAAGYQAENLHESTVIGRWLVHQFCKGASIPFEIVAEQTSEDRKMMLTFPPTITPSQSAIGQNGITRFVGERVSDFLVAFKAQHIHELVANDPHYQGLDVVYAKYMTAAFERINDFYASEYPTLVSERRKGEERKRSGILWSELERYVHMQLYPQLFPELPCAEDEKFCQILKAEQRTPFEVFLCKENPLHFDIWRAACEGKQVFIHSQPFRKWRNNELPRTCSSVWNTPTS